MDSPKLKYLAIFTIIILNFESYRSTQSLSANIQLSYRQKHDNDSL